MKYRESLNSRLNDDVQEFLCTIKKAPNSQIGENAKSIFWLIYKTNNEKRNRYGYSEIGSTIIKKLDQSHYAKILEFLESKNYIKIRRNRATGSKSRAGRMTRWGRVRQHPFCIGYRLSDSIIEDLRKGSGRLLKMTPEMTSPICSLSQEAKMKMSSNEFFRSKDYIESWKDDEAMKSLRKKFIHDEIARLSTKAYQGKPDSFVIPTHEFYLAAALKFDILQTNHREVEDLSRLIKDQDIQPSRRKNRSTDKHTIQPNNTTRIPNHIQNPIPLRGGKLKEWEMNSCWQKISVDVDLMKKDEMDPEDIDKMIRKYQNASYHFIEGRWYGPFQQEKEENMKYILIDGEHIHQAGDAKTCYSQLLAKAIERAEEIPDDEKRGFENLVHNQDIYEEIMKEIGCKDRQVVKKLWNKFINISKRGLLMLERFGDEIMKDIDLWIEGKFPHIRDFIVNYHHEKALDKKTKRMKLKKQLWKKLQNIEYEVITKITSAYVNAKTWPITKHDAVYLKDSDLLKMKTMGIEFENLFNNAVDYKFI